MLQSAFFHLHASVCMFPSACFSLHVSISMLQSALSPLLVLIDLSRSISCLESMADLGTSDLCCTDHAIN